MSDGELRRCGRCKAELPVSAFNRLRGGLQHWCRERFRTYFRERGPTHVRQSQASRRKRAARAKAHVAAYLTPHPCVDCGEADQRVLDFDHLGDKRALVSALVACGAPNARIDEEIARCAVRCANCHRRVTARRAGWSRLAGDVDDPRRGFSAPVRRNLNHLHRVLAAARCVDCGEADMLVLEFDHVGPKRGQVGRMAFNVSLATLEAEIAQCEIRCCNCHRRATAARRAVTLSSRPP